MQLTEHLETGKRYFWKRTDGWEWDGEQRWWVVDVEISGYYGDGGYGLTEYWRWNGQIGDHFIKPTKWTPEQSRDFDQMMVDRHKASSPDVTKGVDNGR